MAAVATTGKRLNERENMKWLAVTRITTNVHGAGDAYEEDEDDAAGWRGERKLANDTGSDILGVDRLLLQVEREPRFLVSTTAENPVIPTRCVTVVFSYMFGRFLLLNH